MFKVICFFLSFSYIPQVKPSRVLMQRIPHWELWKLLRTSSPHSHPLRPVNPTTPDRCHQSFHEFRPHVERINTSKLYKTPKRAHSPRQTKTTKSQPSKLRARNRITMVQGACVNNSGLVSAVDRGQDAKRAGFQALQKKCQDMKSSASTTSMNSSSSKTSSNGQFGAWGPMFQNASNFRNMHNYQS